MRVAGPETISKVTGNPLEAVATSGVTFVVYCWPIDVKWMLCHCLEHVPARFRTNGAAEALCTMETAAV